MPNDHIAGREKCTCILLIYFICIMWDENLSWQSQPQKRKKMMPEKLQHGSIRRMI